MAGLGRIFTDADNHGRVSPRGTSHDINMAARYCRRIVLIKEGRVVADGPPADVIRQDLLSEVYETRLEVSRDPASGHPIAMPAATRT